MKLTINHRRLNGARVILVVDLDADGAMLRWECQDPSTGKIVKLEDGDPWWAIAEMHRAIGRMKRGAA